MGGDLENNTRLDLPPGATPVAVATPNTQHMVMAHQGESGVPMWQQDKQGAKCCGFCCDYRRAVIILNGLTVILGALSIVAGAVLESVVGAPSTNLDDDFVDGQTRTSMITTGVSMFVAICAILGAIKYNIYLVGLNVVWTIASAVIAAIAALELEDFLEENSPSTPYNAIPNIIVTALFSLLVIYPHVGFIYEVKTDVMSAETYPREEHSCCCVTKRT